MMKNVFIDGKAGTTGLRIYERLGDRDDIRLISLSEEMRKDRNARREALNSADIVFLCLPDDAAREAVSMIDNPDTVVFDTSTAHRTEEGWAYGFPELSDAHREKILSSKRIAVPGCHASGFVALVYPLIEAGVIPKNILLSCHSLTGYSGGGKSMIADYSAEQRDPLLDGPRQYALGQSHKHLKEMKALTGLCEVPLFSPIVADLYSGMEVSVPLFKKQLNEGFGIEDIREIYKNKYKGSIVRYEDRAENGFLSAATLSGSDSMAISVYGNEERIMLAAVYDNLGKGASGAAIECFNLVSGSPLTKGLVTFDVN
ncbi:MAG: N-acetyl-gamma-glutamyl-phosphate reductase [Ruminococcaceae bacterium]|nr:N-acetyl-gamma-glutamyl-phosphate reductase [Oscillospiraceae bacterium]